MKVCFLNRAPSAYPGGDVLSINDLIEALQRLGIEAHYLHGEWGPADLAPYDLIHVKHCNFSWSWYNFTQVWASGKPYVVQPIFYPTFALGMNQAQITEALNRSQLLIPQSFREEYEIRQAVDLKAQVDVIPNGCSPAYHFEGRLGREGVLCVSARSGDKNTDLAEKLCREAEIPFKLACGLEPVEVIPLYREARMFLNLSSGERMSRTTTEALCADCRVIDSRHNWGGEWYPGILIVEPEELTPADLRAAYHAPQWNYLPNMVARGFTWDFMARRYKKAYQRALGLPIEPVQEESVNDPDEEE